VIVPGVGVAACQAGADNTHRNQMTVFEELKKGTDPAKIIEILHMHPDIERRQFGILDMQGRTAGFSGTRNQAASLDKQGQVPGTDVFYSIQGNILASDDVVTSAVQALIDAKGELTDRVMAAMEAADAGGGDSRCSCPVLPPDAPAPANPCTAKTAHVAYILMSEPGDTNGDSHNNGTYKMFIKVAQPTLPNGADSGPGAMKPGEDLNPVKTLRARYDVWRKAQGRDYK